MRTDQFVVLEHRHKHERARAAEVDQRNGPADCPRDKPGPRHVLHMDHLLGPDGTPEAGAWTRTIGSSCRASASAGGKSWTATDRKRSPPSANHIVPNFASQSRTAFSKTAWNTGPRSPGELEMTLSTSEVAVCCSSASVPFAFGFLEFLAGVAFDEPRRETRRDVRPLGACAAGLYPPCRRLWHAASLRPAPQIGCVSYRVRRVLW